MVLKSREMVVNVHGTNPEFLIEKVARSRIQDCLFWKESCFALNAETILDRAVELDAIGGHYSGVQKPTAFLCLTLKMLQIVPEPEIVDLYLQQTEFK
jgi:pre-mRNA-splicing factor 38A